MMHPTASNDNIRGASFRFIVEPRLVPPAKAARRLGIDAETFRAKLSELVREGLPLPCPVTGNYDLVAIDAWLDRRAGIGAGRPSADALIKARLDALG